MDAALELMACTGTLPCTAGRVEQAIVPVTHHQMRGPHDPGSVDPIRTGSPLPPWFRSFGLPFAVCCAAIAGIVPLFGVGLVALLSGDGGSPAPAIHAVPIPSIAPPVLHSDASSTDVLVALDSLRRDMQQREGARQAYDEAVVARVRRLETAAVAHSPSSKRGAMGWSAQATDPTAGLGVDWASWTAGAEIDYGYTSTGLGRSILGRASRLVTSLLPRYRVYAGNVSHPPDVVLAADFAPPTKCFAFQGEGTIAIRFPRVVSPTHIVMEQRPSLATLHPEAAPRHFEVRAWLAQPGAEPYSESLGTFEFKLGDAPAQAFPVQSARDSSVKAVQFVFRENWGQDYTSVCRLRVLSFRE